VSGTGDVLLPDGDDAPAAAIAGDDGGVLSDARGDYDAQPLPSAGACDVRPVAIGYDVRDGPHACGDYPNVVTVVHFDRRGHVVCDDDRCGLPLPFSCVGEHGGQYA